MPFSPLWPKPNKDWNFNVSSLIILIGEDQELKYRLSRRSLLQCISAAPVVGLQNYIRSYELLLAPGALTYSSPYGCKTAPLRNWELENAIVRNKLLEDRKFTVYQIRSSSQRTPRVQKYDILLSMWTVITWLYFGGVIVFTILAPETTWIGIANVTILTGWSVLIRLIEHVNIKPAPIDPSTVTDPDAPDAIVILGRNNSAFVLQGNRKDIKDWTTRGLIYENKSPAVTNAMQTFTRLVSLLILLFIFSTVPNGHTMDQLGFIILNALAQANVLISQWLGSKRCLSKLDCCLDTPVPTRTHLYAMLITRFRDTQQKSQWVENLGLLPKTRVWDEWRDSIVAGNVHDAKQLYNEINDRLRKDAGPAATPSLSTSFATFESCHSRNSYANS